MEVPQTQQQNPKLPYYNYNLPIYKEKIIMGQDLPEELKKYFFGFDFEIQLSNLPPDVIQYVGSVVDQINMLIEPILKIANGETTTVSSEWFKQEIQKLNIEAKEIIRAYRGVDGFTIKEMNTYRERSFEQLQREVPKRGILFGRKNKEMEQ